VSHDARLRLAFAGLHPERRRQLLERIGSAEEVVSGLQRGTVPASEPVRRRASRPASECRRRMELLGVRALYRGEGGYPGHLEVLPDPPDVLFLRGGALPASPGVAVVGTRSCTRYGRSLARAYGRAAADAGWPVISGLARGIDGEAHLGVVDAGGRGIAVLGSGPDVVYPAEHRALSDSLLRLGGALVTEYPPGAPPEAWRFPPRNRVIAGLAKAVVVVEAGETGGALITAGIAAEHGLTVLAVPGDVGRPSSTGCNLLIRDGAVPVLSASDFVAAISLILGPPAAGGCSRHADDDASLVDGLGVAGLCLEEAAAAWGLDPAAAAAAAARLELEGRARWDGGILRPVDR
jgi:DNA processing protein